MTPSAATSLRVAAIQVRAGSDWQRNLKRIDAALASAVRRRAGVIAFPENFYWRGPEDRFSEIAREVTPYVIRRFREWARSHRVAVLLGSVLETTPRKGKVANTSLFISQEGKIQARYRKIHLFDVRLGGGREVKESRCLAAGRAVVTARYRSIPVGFGICYDLRFPELFRRLAEKGCRLIFLPANFTYETGRAHWEVLIRARAIENQAYVVAPAQAGVHPATGIKSFGTSLIVDPRGKVLARGGREKEQVLIADLDFTVLKKLRRDFPVLAHRRL